VIILWLRCLVSIAGAYLTSEGVVLGADSTTTVTMPTSGGGKQVAQVFNFAQKVFEVGEHGRMGVCTWGAGGIGTTSHRTLFARLADAVQNEKLTVGGAADRLLTLACEAATTQNDPTAPFEGVGYFLGGWDVESHNPSCYFLNVAPNGLTQKNALSLGEARFGGVYHFFARVFNGYDPDLKLKLHQSLRRHLGSTVPADFDAIFESAFGEAAAPFAAGGFRDLPLREAIDFIYSYLHITVKALKFKFGPPICGGPIEIGFISTDRLFRWARHKSFDIAMEEASPVRTQGRRPE
jgi:hypothetical protein